MNIKNGDCIHIIQYGTFNENRYFLGDYSEDFDLIGINSNIIAYAPSGVGAFIAPLRNKSFFIDPQTHAFQHDISSVMKKKDGEDVVMNSIKCLSEIYGTVIKANVGNRALETNDFSDDAINLICQNTLRFELNVIEDAIRNSEYWEFLEDQEDLDLKPNILIAPYLFFKQQGLSDLLNINKRFIDESKRLLNSVVSGHGKPLFAEIVIEKEIMRSPSFSKEIIDMYSECDVDGFMIWIDDFQESSASESDLWAYKKLLIELNKSKKPILDLRGSYFSIVLASKEISLLAGVGHGIEYGENRKVIPVRGGVPRAKFYFPQFHQRVDYDPDATKILLEMGWAKNKSKYLENVCPCDICKSLIKNSVTDGFAKFGETKTSEKNNQDYSTGEALDKSRKHYLNNKKREYEFCRNSSLEKIIEKLERADKLSKQIRSYSFSHMKEWLNVLQ